MGAMKGLNNSETAELIKSCIFSWIWGNHLKHFLCWAILNYFCLICSLQTAGNQ